MYTFIFPIKTALISFPIIAFFFTFPFLIYQYRKHGYINKLRVFILYSMLLYLITAYYLIILPLPKTRDILSIQKAGTQHYQLILFNFINDIAKETKINFHRPSSYIYLLKERAFLQVAFNAILLTPLGVYLRYYFKKDLKSTIILSFFCSLFFELTQLTGLYGYYNAPYRIFDVDDLMLNTVGGLIGYLIEPILVFFLPDALEIDKDINLSEMRVSYFRRFFALMIDLFIISLVPFVAQNSFIKLILMVSYFIVLSYFNNGKTIGKWVVRIKIQGQGKKITFKEVIKRYGVLYLGVFGINSLMGAVVKLNINSTTLSFVVIVVGFIMLIINVLLFFHMVSAIFKKDRLFYEKFSNTRVSVAK